MRIILPNAHIFSDILSFYRLSFLQLTHI